MSAAIVLSLEEVCARDLLTLVSRGALRPGRITPRGAVVYEPTAEGIAALEAWADDPAGELAALGQVCRDGECHYADEHTSEREFRHEAEQKLGNARDALADLANHLAKARISEAAKAALVKLGEALID